MDNNNCWKKAVPSKIGELKSRFGEVVYRISNVSGKAECKQLYFSISCIWKVHFRGVSYRQYLTPWVSCECLAQRGGRPAARRPFYLCPHRRALEDATAGSAAGKNFLLLLLLLKGTIILFYWSDYFFIQNFMRLYLSISF